MKKISLAVYYINRDGKDERVIDITFFIVFS